MYSVFIVDDEPFILEGLPHVIRWEEYGLVITGQASDGLEALEMLRTTPVDILITDITMPRMNGLELIRDAKLLNPELKCIILSGYHEFDYIKQGMALGIENYLLKPINIEELKVTVSSTAQKITDTYRKEMYSRSDLDILRDNILYRWMTDAIDAGELKHRAQLLGFRLDYPVYAVAAVKLAFEAAEQRELSHLQRDHLISEAYQLCRSRLENDNNACVTFIDTDGDIMAIFGLKDADSDCDRVRDLLRQIGSVIQEKLAVRAVITLADAEHNYVNAGRSYDSAKKLQEYYLIHSEEAVIERKLSIRDAKQAAAGGASIDLDAYGKLLFGKSKPELFAWIDAFFQRLQAVDAAPPAQIQNHAVEIIIHTKRLLKDVKLSNELVSNDYKELFSSLFRIQLMEELKEHVKYIAGAAIDCLVSEDDELSPVIKQVLKHISVNYAEELSLKTLSQTFNINPVYLGQLFQKETGESFSDYVNKFRIETARKLLVNTHLKTIDIGKRVGYADTSYFYKQFKKYAGISPTEFRGLTAEAEVL
ncbi:DNA-binding response regulator [Paenibacillus baekrokdamisoli]|uniref:DNA-binding response regulator n=1 Tax=Paenibacillus baekrokdamisoli TaxID=1712516 RepID=A0A3G9JFB1_9BACL|nr:response regulator transcription factor [Paenibacillus baekrokdamisoli]MBB3068229.1 two-component system response regulator YesN [Paenibacillus baekrokdamisoli]BBH22728.1 DNA-binding response regulator [Paenibacillus baekrokdamisoli]